MPRGRKRREDGGKEIEQLKKRRQKAQEKGDIIEESKLCNAMGEYYSQKGEYRESLQYHQCELALSEAAGDLLGCGIASRKVGECLCELGDYREAIESQKKHLEISRQIENLAEEQRALATLGRTFFIQSQGEKGGSDRVNELLLEAGSHYLQSLDVCDKLIGHLSDRELLEMRSRLYLNLGLVYENQVCLTSAKKFMEKALGILKELGESVTAYQCHLDLGLLHLQEHHTSLALESFQEALKLAREMKSREKESETLREVAHAYLELFEFECAKSCFKRVLKLSGSTSMTRDDIQSVEKQLKAVRRVLYYTSEVEKRSDLEKVGIYERLGDVCCELRTFTSAIKFYGQQLNTAEELDFEPKELCPIYVSLARTLVDSGQYSQALYYYNKELQAWKGNPVEECESWFSIALARDIAGEGVSDVMEAYNNAAALAEEVANPKKLMSLYKIVIKYINGHENSNKSISFSSLSWQQKLSRLLEAHPSLANEGSSDDEEEDSQGIDTKDDLSEDLEFSLSSLDEEDEEESGVGLVIPENASRRNAVIRNKSKFEKKNERGESLLQVAVIRGDLVTVKGLIKKGAEVNSRDNCGWIPLHEACNYGYLEIAQVLVDNGANINDPGGPNCEGITPLIDAAMNGHEDIVRFLVERGADLTIKDMHGCTALAIVMERLSSDAKSDNYDLEEEHLQIRDFLQVEMRRRGLHVEEATLPNNGVVVIPEKKGKCLIQERTGHQTDKEEADTRISNKGNLSVKRKERSRPHDRWDTRALYDSSDDETDDETNDSYDSCGDEGHNSCKQMKMMSQNVPYVTKRVKHAVTPHDVCYKGDNSLRNSPDPISPSESINRNRSINRTQRANSTRDSGSIDCLTSQDVFYPPRQVKVPGHALICEGEEMEIDEATGCPIINNWLVDDIGASPTRKKRRQRDLSVERESRALIGLTSSSSSLSGNRGRDVILGTHKMRCHHNAAEKRSTGLSTSKGKSSKTRVTIDGYRNLRVVREGFTDDMQKETSKRINTNLSSSLIQIESSDSDIEEDFKKWKRERAESNLEVRNLSVNLKTSLPPPSCVSPPLRVKVRIENFVYLIPCPCQVDDGKETPISWLINEASERYSSQNGRRPLLSLKTVDGALLCCADPISHVLGQDQEVVGVVEEWFCPPLADRYQMACRTSGVECHSKTLELFEKINSTAHISLDLSNFNLKPQDSTPIFQALQSQCDLTSISFSGNRLRDEAMPRLQSALGELPLLHSLDLSSTGTTYQGIDSLVRSSPTSSTGNLWKNLHVLNLSHNKLGVASGHGLSKLLRLCRGLQELYIGSCGLSSEVLEAETGFSEALKCLSELRVLSLEKNPLGSTGLCLLFQTLSSLKVTSLNISRVISAKISGDKPLSRVLKEQTTLDYFRKRCGQDLEVLNVSYCSHGDGDAMKSLMDCLESCSRLKELRVAGWGLISEHIEPLCSFLSLADCLCILDVSGNVHLGNGGALSLLKACNSRLHLEGDACSQINLNLVACGIESPLPDEFIKAVNVLCGGKKDAKKAAVLKVDLFGNLIDKKDMALLS